MLRCTGETGCSQSYRRLRVMFFFLFLFFSAVEVGWDIEFGPLSAVCLVLSCTRTQTILSSGHACSGNGAPEHEPGNRTLSNMNAVVLA